jgi:hypothetical protein
VESDKNYIMRNYGGIYFSSIIGETLLCVYIYFLNKEVEKSIQNSGGEIIIKAGRIQRIILKCML